MTPLLCQHISHVLFGRLLIVFHTATIEIFFFLIKVWFHISAHVTFDCLKVLYQLPSFSVVNSDRFSSWGLGDSFFLLRWSTRRMALRRNDIATVTHWAPTTLWQPHLPPLHRFACVCACVCFVKQSGEQCGSGVAAEAWPIPGYCLCVMSTHHEKKTALTAYFTTSFKCH